MAFGRVNECREEVKGKVKTKKRWHIGDSSYQRKGNVNGTGMNIGVAERDIANAKHEAYDKHVESDLESSSTEPSDGYTESTDSENIL